MNAVVIIGITWALVAAVAAIAYRLGYKQAQRDEEETWELTLPAPKPKNLRKKGNSWH